MHAKHGHTSFVVAISAFMLQVISFGISSSIGIYNMEFLDYFTHDAVAVSLVASINIGCFQGTGPIVSFLMTKFEHRTIILTGSLISFVGLVVIPWLPSLEYLYIFHGAMTGIGYCFVFVPSQVLSGLYFEKGRSLATGIITSGSGLGTAIFPILVGNLIEIYTWKGSIFIIAGISLNLLVFGALLRPLPEVSQAQIEVEEKISALSTKALKRPLKNFRVFTSFCFDVFFVNNICYNMCACIFLSFGPVFFTTHGLSNIDAAFQLTIAGITTFIGAIVGGILGNIPHFNRFGMYFLSNILEGIAVMMFPLVYGLSGISALCAFFGFFFGICIGLLVMVTIDILGAESMGDGIGYLMLANGIGAFIGPVIAGTLKDLSGNYSSSIYLAGGVSVCGGTLMLLIPLKIVLAKWYDIHINKIDPPDELPFKRGQDNDNYKNDGSHVYTSLKVKSKELSGENENGHYGNEVVDISEEKEQESMLRDEDVELSGERGQENRVYESLNDDDVELSGKRGQENRVCESLNDDDVKLSGKRGQENRVYESLNDDVADPHTYTQLKVRPDDADHEPDATLTQDSHSKYDSPDSKIVECSRL